MPWCPNCPDTLKLLLTANDGIEAHLVQSILADYNIPAFLRHRESGAYMELYMGMTMFGIDIYVPSKDLPEAKELLNIEDKGRDSLMKVLLVYDSFFGNTEQIAGAIGNGLGAQEKMELVRVKDFRFEQLNAVDLFIVGSPTRGFRPSETISKMLAGIPEKHLAGVRVAAFDTRVSLETIQSAVLRALVRIGGYAADSIAKKLNKKGGRLVAAPEGFFVQEREGPLLAGEIERAADWAQKLSMS